MLVDPQALTPGDMKTMMLELATMFGGKKDLPDKTDLYYRILGQYPLASVRAAVNRVLEEEHKYFPVVGRLKLYAREHMIANRPARTDGSLDDTLLCSTCREPLGWHRVVKVLDGISLMIVKSMIRHRDDCYLERWQATVNAHYGYSWVDTLPDRGEMQPMDQAWRCGGVEPAIDILPETLAEREARLAATRRTKREVKPGEPAKLSEVLAPTPEVPS